MKNILEKILKKEPIIEYITTGDDDLDKKILGYQKGELITIASRPGFGKTALALKSVIANIRKGKKVHYWILGESGEKIIARIIAQMLNIKINDLLLGTYTNVDEFEMRYVIDIINEYLVLEVGTFVDIEYILNRSVEQNNDLDLLVIDGMEYLKTLCDKEDIVKYIKADACIYKIPIILIASIDINVEKNFEEKPMLHDINNAKNISEYSDKVIVIYSDDFYKAQYEAKQQIIARNEGLYYKSTFKELPIVEKDIIILKNSFGFEGTLALDFFKNIGAFVSKEKEELKIVFE
jgi:replicative DNA helicase